MVFGSDIVRKSSGEKPRQHNANHSIMVALQPFAVKNTSSRQFKGTTAELRELDKRRITAYQ
jgi:hypothetical protein